MVPPFAIVIPTYRRARMLARVLPSYVATGADEVVIVDDGSGQPHARILATLHDPPGVRVVTLRHVGLPAARNAGVNAVSGRAEWVAFGEDDCWYPRAYPATLIEHAMAADAVAASGSARLVHPDLLSRPADELERAIAAGETQGVHPVDRLMRITWPVEELANGDVVTPMLTAGAAIRRSVFETTRFDPGFGGNAFREETDFFLSVVEGGGRTVRCRHATCGHVKEHARADPGGAWTMGPLRYGAWMVRNNWRLIRKHEPLLREVRARTGRPAGPLRMQAEFMAELARRARGPRERAAAPSAAGARSSTSPPPEGPGSSR